MRKPYFVKRLKCWYVRSSKAKEIRLDPDKHKAFALWHELQATRVSTGGNATVIGLIDAFFDFLDGTVSAPRMKSLIYYASSFAEKHGTDLAVTIGPSTVTRWLALPKPGRLRSDDNPVVPITWKSSSKRHASALLKRIWKWAHNQGRIPVNSLAELKLPECDYRDGAITIDLETHNRLVQHCMSIPEARSFAIYLIASRCGARPQQIREVTAKNVSRDGTRWIFKEHKTTAKTGKALTVYLSPCLQTLTKILVASRPKGKLFLNFHGNPWKAGTVTQRMERLRIRLKLPEGTVVYMYRHSMATDALIDGHSIAVVAQLLGHTDTRMVAKVYGHLDKCPEHLLNAVNKTAQSRLKPK
jgi:integrase